MDYQISREVFFNLGGPHGVVRLIVYAIALLVMAGFIYLLVKKIKVWRLGQSEKRTDKIVTRLWGIVEYVFLQVKILGEKLPGITHFFLFWGFGVLFVGTALIVIQEDFTLLVRCEVWYGNFYKFYSLALDLFGLFALIAIIVFAVAMALDQIGLGNDVVNMAFGLILAGAALAAALAFGLGGKDVAKYQLVRWYKSAEASLATPPAPDAKLDEPQLSEDKPAA